MTLLFYYTLIIMFFYTLVAACSLCAYFVSRRKAYLFATLGFAFYFFDVSLVFKDNFITPSAVFDAPSFYDVGNPLATIITGAGTFLFLWLAVCRYCREGRWPIRFLPTVVWVAASAAAYLLIKDPQWREFIFYSMRALLLFFSYGVLLYWYRTSPDAQRRSIMRGHRTAYLCAVGLTVAIVLENVYFQLIYDPSNLPSGMWIMAERSPSENMLFVCIGLAVLHAAQVTLRLRAAEVPAGSDPLLAESIDRLMPLYVQAHELSKREEEVLRYALMGLDNQNIASTLSLTAGTVKVHMHNILKKTGHANRTELAQHFWEH